MKNTLTEKTIILRLKLVTTCSHRESETMDEEETWRTPTEHDCIIVSARIIVIELEQGDVYQSSILLVSMDEQVKTMHDSTNAMDSMHYNFLITMGMLTLMQETKMELMVS